MEDETMLDEQDPKTSEEEVEETEEEEYTDSDDTEDGDEDTDGEIEYDEDGNIILPDDDEGDDADEDENEKSDEKPKEDAKNTAEDAKYRRLEAQARATLEMLGEELREGEDILDALERIAAETKGVSRAEYRKEIDDANELEAAKKLLKNMEYEKMAQADLSVLHSEFPETKQYKHIKDMPAEVMTKFAHYRGLGLPAKEAYAAANPDGIRTGAASAARQKARNDGKSHLTSTVPKRASDRSTTITKQQMTELRSLFPDKSDKEIIALYRSVSTKK
jgi:hypothetical protein